MDEHLQVDYSPAEVERVFGVAETEVRAAISAGQLVAKRWGGSTRINLWQLAEWNDLRRAKSQAQPGSPVLT